MKQFDLKSILHNVAKISLPGGMVGKVCKVLIVVAIAMAANPKLLLLDEPLAGMNPVEVSGALETIGEIRRRGTSVLLIEHNMRAVMSICDRIVVLNFGTEIARGSPEEVKQNEEVIKAYLGAGEHA